MHKLRNTRHKEILERIFDIIPSGYNESPFKKFKKEQECFVHSINGMKQK
jgi:hypothetical protein